MASPSTRESDSQQLVPAGSAMDRDSGAMDEIPRRIMRVKVLYTFDDKNKSNCLARLPNALNIPTVSLDETTQVGVIELKSCIQAIVAASPELVAKLGHDYTVYAYDYSEYETPLVGQGMLSWILASASTTPSAPASQSQTMVTGRVCKNILGLFANGIKETLEVKLRLVPVPTCMQKEYVENMERYHSLSKIASEGLDYTAWTDWLKAHPAIGQLSHPTPQESPQRSGQDPPGGVESLHGLLTRQIAQEGEARNDQYPEQHELPYNSQETRASSPAMSTRSFHHYQGPESRPGSRGSFRSEPAMQLQPQSQFPGSVQYHQDEGPPKKRARVTKAKRPKKTALSANNDSLRVTASTAASVRLHRPVATNPAAATASSEQIPRAPTPRPGDVAFRIDHDIPRRPPPSLLRYASLDETRPLASPYESAPFSDNAVDSVDDERGPSPVETPMDIPSSPPILPQQIESPAPSSPGLPTLPYPTDSGFVSDVAMGKEDENMDSVNRQWEGCDLPVPTDTRIRAKPDRSHRDWMEVTPGPVELLPNSYIPKPKTYPRSRQMQSTTDGTDMPAETLPQTIEKTSSSTSSASADQSGLTSQSQRMPDGVNASSATDSLMVGLGQDAKFVLDPQAQVSQHQTMAQSSQIITPLQPQQSFMSVDSPDTSGSTAPFSDDNDVVELPSRSTTPNLPSSILPRPFKPPQKSRSLPRSHTWSGEPISDAPIPVEGALRNPRSGSGAKRKQRLVEKMNASIMAGELPTYCNNCGEIETPTWRKAYTRVEDGSPAGIVISTEGAGIVAFEVMDPKEDSTPQYRIFKQVLEQGEKESDSFTQITLCNPCGLWLTKKAAMRPAELWAKKIQGNQDKPKRRRNPPKGPPQKRAKGPNDNTPSDAMVPYSEPVMPPPITGSVDEYVQPPTRSRTASFQFAAGTDVDDAFAAAALERAIQSSPPGFQGSKESPINLEPDLTPKPTRRLLFPSPRKAGEVKSLGDGSSASPTDRLVRKPAEPPVRLPNMDDEIDKENCPPQTEREVDDLAHLFDDRTTPKTTPTKGACLPDLLKTPTPGSRRRAALTPRGRTENSVNASFPGPVTPSRALLTPKRSGRAATVAPLTPFTAQLNAILSDCGHSSPSQNFDFSTFPTFNSPGRNVDISASFGNLISDDFLSSDLPMPSSPPGNLEFSLYEDPATSTVGLWSGPSIFEGSDAIVFEDAEGNTNRDANTSQIPEISVDFAAMIEEVVRSGSEEARGKDDKYSAEITRTDGSNNATEITHVSEDKNSDEDGNEEMDTISGEVLDAKGDTSCARRTSVIGGKSSTKNMDIHEDKGMP
ncbi:hypothetical protein CC78DRAFT_508567 [Lojkania enalia]|uniref:Ams2/SPT21 N-terminal domain-containing protein n=1 Tax=Lojkania enalia TaxID=147567 RepID=A0A9P4TQS5_9PLEO|nr:hypothetical protein CC78DRAFT_508567 [Didymosphaeria enalia]